MSKRRIRLGIMLDGAGGTNWGWRHPGVNPRASIDIGEYQTRARQCEAEKLDFIFIADSLHVTAESPPHFLNRFEPLTLLSALSVVTSRIGLVGTISTSFADPFTVARQLGSLDVMSGGRAGWNVVTSALEGTARNFSQSHLEDHAARYLRAEEHVEVTRGLWDSWEDDAFVYDKEAGRFFDPAKLHWLRHEGRHYSVAGPLNIARSKQGHPVIFQAGASDTGRAFAAGVADALFALPASEEEAREYTSDIKQRAIALGRDPASLLVFTGLDAVIGASAEEAEAKYRELAKLVTIDEALRLLSHPFSYHDLTQYGLNAPFPDIAHVGANSYRSVTERIIRNARSRNLTLRQAALEHATPRTDFIGTPTAIADAMQRWFEVGACDGFIILVRHPGALDDLLHMLLPELRRRGLFRSEYEADTLRGNLGVAIPRNRHAKAAHS